MIKKKYEFAGLFYPADKYELKKKLKNLFDNSVQHFDDDTLAIISPHAGYVYSGEIAANAYSSIHPDKKIENIFILSSSHTVSFEGASIYAHGNFETPLGEVVVNTELANDLLLNHDAFIDFPEAFDSEHSLEVQLPFIQYYLKNNFKIVPIIIGNRNSDTPKLLAKLLRKYLNSDNLFVISSDFSHFPNYKDAVSVDAETTDSICTGEPEKFINQRNKTKIKGIRGLSTDICGASAVLTLLYMTNNDKHKYKKIAYQNSGDSIHGEKDRVVGYWAIQVSEKKTKKFTLTQEEKSALIGIASKSIMDKLGVACEDMPEYKISTKLSETKCGVFVTLKKNGKLRGCLGCFTSEKPLYHTVKEIAISSAFQDYRFSPLNINELSEISIEISVLSPLQKINSIDEIVLGKHGIYIIKDGKSGTFLPSVATEHNMNLSEFLGTCAENKAGIGYDGWKDADIYIYETINFGDNQNES